MYVSATVCLEQKTGIVQPGIGCGVLRIQFDRFGELLDRLGKPRDLAIGQPLAAE